MRVNENGRESQSLLFYCTKVLCCGVIVMLVLCISPSSSICCGLFASSLTTWSTTWNLVLYTSILGEGGELISLSPNFSEFLKFS